MQRERTAVWIDGIQRHLEDLKGDAYDVLQQASASLLRGTGDVSVHAPGPDGYGGLMGSWRLTWPELSESSSRMTGKRLQPVIISAVFPPGFTHPQLVAGGPVDPRAASLAAWPMQVTSREDAEQQRPVLWAIATAEVHDRIYQSSWRVIPR